MKGTASTCPLMYVVSSGEDLNFFSLSGVTPLAWAAFRKNSLLCSIVLGSMSKKGFLHGAGLNVFNRKQQSSCSSSSYTP